MNAPPREGLVPGVTGPRVLSVSELTRLVRGHLEEAFPEVWVRGEISNLRRPNSGHLYFTLKDESAQLATVMFRELARRLKFQLEDGQGVRAYGRISVYEPRGQYQLVALRLEPEGIGALELAFQQLKEKLEKEGLFRPERKKPIPRFPEHIGLVTSPSGAAIMDILKVLERRFPVLRVTLFPVRVQGEGAAGEIAFAIDELNRLGGPDVLIVGRGGGSLEDLWAFNEEVVARAIARSAIPIVSAVGHEINVTISDLVADRRALTPTEAAQSVAPDREQLGEMLEDLRERLWRGLGEFVDERSARLDVVVRVLEMAHPERLLREGEQRTDELVLRLFNAIRTVAELSRSRLTSAISRLEALSPLKVLSRGFSVTIRQRDGKVIASHEDVSRGEEIRTLLARGRLTSRVTDTSPE